MHILQLLFNSPPKVFKLVFLVVLAAIVETALLYSLSKFEVQSPYFMYDVSILVVLTLLALIFRLACLWIVNYQCLSAVSQLNTNLLDLIHERSFHNRIQSFNFTSQAEKVQIIGTSVLVPIVNGIASLIIGLCIFAALISLYGFSIVWLTIFIIMFYLFIIVAVKDKLRNSSKILANYQLQRALLINETTDGSVEIEVSNMFNKQKKRFQDNEKDFVRSAARVLFLGGVPRYVLECVLIIALVLVLIFGQTGELETSDLITFAFGCLRLVPLAQQTYNGWARYRGNQTSIQEIINTVTTHENGDFYKPSKLEVVNEGDRLSIHWLEKVKHVQMPSRLQLDFETGKFSAITGRSGIGKSALIHDLIKVLNGTKIDVGLVAPYNARFSCTVNEYMEFFDISNRPRLNDLVKKFNLGKEYDGDFCEKSIIELSTGEFQRAQLIRELIREPRLLILDEAFANLDQQVVSTIIYELKLMQNTAFLLVSHTALTGVPKLMEVNLAK